MTPPDAHRRTTTSLTASGWTRARLASLVDHTMLRPDATREDAAGAAREAAELGAHAVCVSPSMLPLRAEGTALCTVVGFPSGKHHALVKAMEARLAVEQGATELDVVIDYGAILAGRPDELLAELVPLRDAAPAPVRIKVILETAALYDVLGEEAGDAALARACEVAARGGADWVKTSTGFHPAGGATVHAVQVMRAALPASVGVKASGGIGSAAEAIALLEAGATRLGTSRTRQILDELPE